jgi:hypothetical protein
MRDSRPFLLRVCKYNLFILGFAIQTLKPLEGVLHIREARPPLRVL